MRHISLVLRPDILVSVPDPIYAILSVNGGGLGRGNGGGGGLQFKEEGCKGDGGMQSNEIPSTIIHFPEPVSRD